MVEEKEEVKVVKKRVQNCFFSTFFLLLLCSSNSSSSFRSSFGFSAVFQLLKSQGFEEGSFDFHSAAAAEGIFTIRNNIGSFRRCCSFRISSFQTQQQAPAKEWAFFKFFSLSSCSFLTPNKKPEQKLQ